MGDALRWTKNDYLAGRRNGEVAQILAIDAGRGLAKLQVGVERQVLDIRKPQHWDHAYASTVHAAQGKTTDLTILHIDDDHRTLTGHESWYVALSRARHRIEIVCGRRDLLPARIARSMEKQPALTHAIS